MSLTPGVRIGSYEIVAKLGQGGMGEVFKARDVRLGRDVAVKVLPATLSHDADRLARFEREAQTLASLNHPNIALVYGLEEQQSTPVGPIGPFLVMELLEGRSLADVIAAGPLPARKAVDYATQIAHGLAAAHGRGIIHRDLKPDNLFVLPDGRVKILDFGLARQIGSESAADETLMTRQRHTQPGTVMGTAGYMAPEQVRAEQTDARSDLFSLGVVLYEMLAGRRAFQHDTTAETMTAILREDPPDLASLRSDVSPSLLRIVHRCLEKSPAARFQSGSDLAFALETLSASSASHGSGPVTPVSTESTSTPAGPRRRSGRRSAVGWIALGLGIPVVMFLANRFLPKETETAASDPVPYRASIVLPEGVRMSDGLIPARRLAMSPDGRFVTFIAAARGSFQPPDRLWLLSTADGSVRELPGTEEGNTPFWSPDSKSIAFASGSGSLRRVRITGGPPTALASVAGGGSWSADGSITLLSFPPKRQAYRISDAGQTSEAFSAPEGMVMGFPVSLPGSGALLFSKGSGRGIDATGDAGLSVRRANGEETQVLKGVDPLNAAFANGHLLYVIDSTLFARPFDPGTLSFTGDAIPLADDVLSARAAGAAFSVSQSGSLVYAPQESRRNSQLVWMDRSGKVIDAVSDAADYSNVNLSPDERRVAVSVTDAARGTRDIYIVDVARRNRQRFTFDPGEERSAVWERDGRALIFSRERDLFSRGFDPSAKDVPIETDGVSKDPRQVTADGRLILRRSGPAGNDIMIMPLHGGDRTPKPLLDSTFDENYASMSPDGHSLVYVSNESGQNEVYVLSLDGGGKVLLSSGGGTFPRWRGDGKEIVFLSASKTLMSVMVKGSGDRFEASAATPLFKIDPQPGPGEPFDVTADGQHFVVNAVIPSRIPPSFTVIVNWPTLVHTAAH